MSVAVVWTRYMVKHHRRCGFAIEEESGGVIAPPFLKLGVRVAIGVVLEFGDHGSLAKNRWSSTAA